MTTTWFETKRYDIQITPVLVEKETEHSVMVVGRYGGKEARRAAKSSEWSNFHRTWEDAHAYLLQREESKLSAARHALEAANSTFGNVKGMKKPQEAA